ncbi:hypothetical protein AURDEDRAFT_178131, partial [Auricularia subglabra TFB-10046 SS5]
PAGGEFTVEIAENRAFTSLSYNGSKTSAWGDGNPHPEGYGDRRVDTHFPLTEIGCIASPNMHTKNEQDAAGTAFAIAYKSDIHKEGAGVHATACDGRELGAPASGADTFRMTRIVSDRRLVTPTSWEAVLDVVSLGIIGGGKREYVQEAHADESPRAIQTVESRDRVPEPSRPPLAATAGFASGGRPRRRRTSSGEER